MYEPEKDWLSTEVQMSLAVQAAQDGSRARVPNAPYSLHSAHSAGPWSEIVHFSIGNRVPFGTQSRTQRFSSHGEYVMSHSKTTTLEQRAP